MRPIVEPCSMARRFPRSMCVERESVDVGRVTECRRVSLGIDSARFPAGRACQSILVVSWEASASRAARVNALGTAIERSGPTHAGTHTHTHTHWPPQIQKQWRRARNALEQARDVQDHTARCTYFWPAGNERFHFWIGGQSALTESPYRGRCTERRYLDGWRCAKTESSSGIGTKTNEKLKSPAVNPLRLRYPRGTQHGKVARERYRSRVPQSRGPFLPAQEDHIENETCMAVRYFACSRVRTLFQFQPDAMSRYQRVDGRGEILRGRSFSFRRTLGRRSRVMPCNSSWRSSASAADDDDAADR